MKLIAGQAYLELFDAVECGLGDENYLRKEKSRGAKWAIFIKDPSDLRKILIEYDSLPQPKKDKVLQRFGNPYEYLAKEPIRRMIVKDLEVERFFLEYSYGDNKRLPIEKVKEYTTAANWLKMLDAAEQDKKELKKQLGVSVTQFWMNVIEIIQVDNISLPTNPIRLRQKVDIYKQQGPACLIHKHYGNGNAKKIDCELSESLMLELISMPNADDVMTARRYNTWAKQNGKEPIKPRTVTNWRHVNEHLISGSKYGSHFTYNTFGKHIIRKRPTAPNLLWESDDNELDLYFKSVRQSKKGGTEVFYFDRFVLAVVVDAFNDYIVGWAIDETFTKDLIRLAYLDAVHHIKEITGEFYLPHQIRTDHFGLNKDINNDLAEFYKSIAIYTPAKVRNSRAKYIERTFGDRWHQVLRCFPNYAGSNMSSSEKIGKVNEDYRDLVKSEFPDSSKAPSQALQVINALRMLVDDKTGKSKQEEWIEAFQASDKSRQHKISGMQMFLKLGTQHPNQITITNRGVSPAINCKERTYEIPEEQYLQTIKRKVTVIYDPLDYSHILLTDFQHLNIIARTQEEMPSAIADYQPGDRARLNDRLEEKVRHMQYVNSKKESRVRALDRAGIDARSLLQAGVHTKAVNHEALIAITEEMGTTRRELPGDRPKTDEDLYDMM